MSAIADIRNALVPVRALIDLVDEARAEDVADAREGLTRALALLDDLRGAPRLQLEGVQWGECSLAEFLGANLDGFSDEDVVGVARLSIGETYRGGGGAAAEWSVRRVR